jgi:hypothetical protein
VSRRRGELRVEVVEDLEARGCSWRQSPVLLRGCSGGWAVEDGDGVQSGIGMLQQRYKLGGTGVLSIGS